MPGSDPAGAGGADGGPSGDSGSGGDSGDGAGSSGEPGFGDMAGGADLPSMVDTLPTFDEDYGAEGEDGAGNSGSPEGNDDGQGTGGSGNDGQVAQQAGDGGAAGNASSPGTRASGGMESDMGTGGPMTAAEQVAILDRQLEESTRDFDGIIFDEEERQREAARDRAAQSATARETPEPEATASESGFITGTVSSAGQAGVSSSGTPSYSNAPEYPVPEDIPALKSNPDVIARQLYEAATREPDPEKRERLWNEYRKLMGIEIPSQ